MLLHEKALMIQRLRFSVSSSESLNKAKMLTAMQDWRIELRKELRAEMRPARIYCCSYVAATSLALELTAKSEQNLELAACKALARLKK